MVMQAWRRRTDPFPKPQDNALLLRVDPVKTGRRPNSQKDDQQQDK
jgi:hypothetical protein